jgi:hypothetical protein
MKTLNGLKFAKNDKEFTASLFDKTGTAFGYYKVLKGCVHLMNMQGDIFAAVVKNKSGFCGIVSARKLDNGKVFYQYGLGENYENLLGVPKGYIASIEYANQAFNMFTQD